MRNKWVRRLLYTLLTLFILVNVFAAFHAYKFTHFYDDGGHVKTPPEMSKAEKLNTILFGVKTSKSKTVDSFQVPHSTIKLTTTDSIQLEAWYLQRQPDDSIRAKGTVLMFHGHGGSKSGITKEAAIFWQQGYDVLMTDFRAHGNSQGNTCTIGYNESQDVKAAYDFIQKQNEGNIIMWGTSMGASTIMKAVYDYSLKPQKLILEMPFGSLLDAVKGRMRMMGLPAQPLASMLTFWGGVEQGFWAFDYKPWDYATKINCPVLLQHGLLDKRVSQDETIKVFKNLASHNKTLIEYVKSGHESFCKNEQDKWIKTVTDFLNE